VIAQARRVASELPDRARFHRLGRKMLAADGLAILLCAAILLLASPAGTGPPVVAASDDEEEIPLSAELQRELAVALRQAARAGQAATAAESYEQLADAVEADDAQAVAEILRRLREEGVALRRVLPSRPARTLEAVGRHASQSADDDHAFEPAETASETTDAATVGVNSPDGADASADPAGTADRPGRDFSDAWRAARQRAQRSVRGGRTPAEYRPILRRYFDLESSNP
jgi:hypothetical protein